MDEVQAFIARNQHQFGYIMQEASRQWKAKDNVGALTVGETNFVIEKYGQHHELLEKVKRYEKALHAMLSISFDDDLDVMVDIITDVLMGYELYEIYEMHVEEGKKAMAEIE